MTAVTKPTEPKTTALASHVGEMRERNAMVTAIKGQMWSKDMSETQVRALAHYCNTNGLDASRHVEVLGGRIYLTADFYRERGAKLMQDGLVTMDEPRYINTDARLDKLADAGDEWAKQERDARLRERILRNAPEEAKAIAVVALRVRGSDTPIIGVNWCGGIGKRDPVGDAEPSKTAVSRAERRAWRQLVEVVPEYGVAIQRIEATAKVVADEIATIAASEPALLTDGGPGDGRPRVPDPIRGGDYPEEGR